MRKRVTIMRAQLGDVLVVESESRTKRSLPRAAGVLGPYRLPCRTRHPRVGTGEEAPP